MRRIAAVLFALAVCCGAWAAGAKEGAQYITITGGYHGGIESATINKVKTKSTMAGFALGMEGRSMLVDDVGIGVKWDIYVPQRLKVSAEGHSQTVDRSAYTALFGFNMMFGPAIMPVRGERFGLNITPALHLGYLISSTDTAATFAFVMGLGVDISADLYLARHCYLNGGISLSYDFYSFGSTTVAVYGERRIIDNSGGLSTFMFQPRLGVGFRW